MSWNLIVDWSSVIGFAVSAVGLIITAVVAIRVGTITRNFLFQARMPQLRKKISGHVTAISSLLGNFPGNRTEIDVELKKCQANLKNLVSKLDSREVRDVKALIRRIQCVKRIPLRDRIHLVEHLSDDQYKKRVEDIHSDLAALDELLGNLREDYKWRPCR